jgi:hypothetical protein
VKRSRFKAHPIGFFHIDIPEAHTEERRLYLFVAVDRTSKFAFAQLHERATRRIAPDFLYALVAAVPYRIHTVLTDNDTEFVGRTPSNEEAEAALRPRLQQAPHRAPNDQACAPVDEWPGGEDDEPHPEGTPPSADTTTAATTSSGATFSSSLTPTTTHGA